MKSLHIEGFLKSVRSSLFFFFFLVKFVFFCSAICLVDTVYQRGSVGNSVGNLTETVRRIVEMEDETLRHSPIR